ncbi:MAG TPA: hypothetical protein VMC86_05830 [Gemmatimonadales bacterium]|nr:hypothetical protein [Gemmatimonadales bacterium]
MITRGEATPIYDAICSALENDDFSYKYSSNAENEAEIPGTGGGFSIQMERKTGGRGAFRVTVDNPSRIQPIRFLVQADFQGAPDPILEDFDAVAEAAFGALPGQWSRVMAEARMTAQLEAPGGSATDYMLKHAVKLNANGLEALDSSPVYFGLAFETAAGYATESDQLAQPKREAKLEVLREDVRSLYIEVMSQWTQVPPVVLQPDTPSPQLEVDPARIRRFEEPPSAYVRNTIDFVHEVFLPLFA